jgi:hypothetical protein
MRFFDRVPHFTPAPSRMAKHAGNQLRWLWLLGSLAGVLSYWGRQLARWDIHAGHEAYHALCNPFSLGNFFQEQEMHSNHG